MNFRQLISLLTGLVGVRIAGAAAALTMQIILARSLSQADMGYYFLAIAVASFAGMLMTGGHNSLAVTQLARYRALKRPSLVKSYIRAAIKDSIIVAVLLLVAGLITLIAFPLENDLRILLILGLATAPAAAIIRIQSAIANSYRRFSISFVPDFLIRPLALLAVVLTGLVAFGHITLLQLMVAYLVLAYLIALLQFFLLRPIGAFLGLRSAKTGKQVAIWRRRARSLIIVALITIAFTDIATLTAGLFLQADQLGVFGICIRLAVLVGFVTQACSQFVLPDLTDAIATHGRAGVRPVLLRANVLSVGVSMAALIGTFMLGDFALGLFGPDYAGYSLLLATLILGQILRAGSAMNMQLLSLDGQQMRVARLCVTYLSILVLGAALLAPSFGVYGIAMAVVAADCVWALGTGWLANKHLAYRGDLFALLSFPSPRRSQIA